MATFSVEIPDDDVDRVITAMCANYRYSAQVSNPEYNPDLDPEDPSFNADIPTMIDNPETPHQFANRMTRDYLMNNTHAYEVRWAKENAVNSVPPPPAIEDATQPQASNLYGYSIMVYMFAVL